MYLSSLYIDGYGPFSDSLIGELTEGFNLVLAEDDAAAGSLRDFIWAVLLGFDRVDGDLPIHDEGPGRATGGFLGFESPNGPVTVARYRRGRGGSDETGSGLVTITGSDEPLERLVGAVDTDRFRRLVQIDTTEVAQFREVIRRQIEETIAEQARQAAEAESAMREGAGQINVPSIEEIMDEMRTARNYQLARVDNLARSARGVGKRLRATRKREALLRVLVEVRPAWNTILELQRQMSELPRMQYLHEDLIRRLEDANEERREARAGVDSIRDSERVRSEEIRALRPPEQELAREREIQDLLPARADYDLQIESIAEAEAELGRAEKTLESRLVEIGDDWTVERAKTFASSVTPADIEQHEEALGDAAAALELARGDERVAESAAAEAGAEAEAARTRLERHGEYTDIDPVDIRERIDILQTLKATAAAVTARNAEVAALHVKRAEAWRLGSGMSRMVVMAQAGVSAALFVTGVVVWAAALRAGDNSVQTTGLVMVGAGAVGGLFSAIFLSLMRRKSLMVSVGKDGRVDADAGLRNLSAASLAALRTAFIAAREYVRERTASRRAAATEDQSVAADESGVQDDSAATAGDEAAAPDGGGRETGQRLSRLKVLLGRLVQVKRRGPEEHAPAGDAEPITAEDRLLMSIAGEIEAEEVEDTVAAEIDLETVSAAVEAVEAEVPDELREAQERAVEPRGKVADFIARLLHLDGAPPEPSDQEILAEMDDGGERPVSVGNRISAVWKRLQARLRPLFSRRGKDTPLAAAEQELEPPETESAGPAEDGTLADVANACAVEEGAAEPEAASEDATPEDATADSDDASARVEVAAGPEAAPETAGAKDAGAGDERTGYRVSDPLTALDHAVAEAMIDIEALKEEADRLAAAYAASDGPPVDDVHIRMAETAGSEIARLKSLASARKRADEYREEFLALEERRREKRDAAREAAAAAREAESAAEVAAAGWSEWLATVALTPDMSPADVRKISAALDPIRVSISAVELLQERVDGLRADAQELESRVREVAGDAVSARADVISAFNALERAGAAIKDRLVRIAELEDGLRSVKERRAEAEAELRQADLHVQAVLDEAGARDGAHLRELIVGAAKRRSLADELDRIRVATPLLTGIDSASLEARLRTISHEQVEAELAELPEHIARLKSQLSDLESDLTAAEIELASMPEIPETSERAAPGPSEHGGDAGLMPALLAEPMDEQVLKAASRYLGSLTKGRYTRLFARYSESGDSITGYRVAGAGGDAADPKVTDAFAVFMALRLALTEAQVGGTMALPAPVVDFSGMSDTAASRIAMESLLALSSKTQVICLTGDPSSAARFAASGAAGAINLVDATHLDSPFRSVVGGN